MKRLLITLIILALIKVAPAQSEKSKTVSDSSKAKEQTHATKKGTVVYIHQSAKDWVNILNLPSDVVSFDFSVNVKSMLITETQKNGSKITSSMYSYIQSLGKGDKFWIDNIKAKAKDGSSYSMAGITYIIK